MNNLNDEAKAFRPRFNSAIKKSAIRKTSQAGDARNLATSFQQQTAALVNEYEQTNKASSVPSVLSTADQIEKLINDLKLDPRTLGWEKIRADLNQVSSALGITPPAAAERLAVQLNPLCAGRGRRPLQETGRRMPAGFAGHSSTLQQPELMRVDHR